MIEPNAQLFPPCSVIYGGKATGGRKIKCGKCGHEERKPFNGLRVGQGFDENVADQQIARKFRSGGWLVGKTASQHRCLKCQITYQTTNGTKPMTVDVTRENIVQMKADPPRQMQREDRRLVYSWIEERWLDEKRGYESGWTDKRIADDLGVPVAWVRTIRDENFGAVSSNPEIENVLAETRAWREDVRKLTEVVTHMQTAIKESARLHAEKIIGDVNKVVADVNALARTGEALERKIVAIEKELGRI